PREPSERRSSNMSPRRAHNSSSGTRLVAFEVGDVRYALAIDCVREIMRPLPALALPDAPAAVLGVIDHRGEVVPVLDLRKRFAATPSARARNARFVIVERGGRRLGLAVDGVNEVFAVEQADARIVPSEFGGQR